MLLEEVLNMVLSPVRLADGNLWLPVGSDGRWNDFVDVSGHSRTWLSRNSRGIQNRFHYSCGLGHARLCHFLLDAGTCGVGAFFLTFLIPHAPIMISRWKPSSPLSHSC